MTSILLIEDSPTDAHFVEEALAELDDTIVLQHFSDGVAATEHLAMLTALNLPSVIIIDLNLPGRRGDEILEYIKSSKTLKATPVVIMSSSRSNADIKRCYESQANCYIVKPLELEQFFGVIHSLQRFWLQTASLPKGGHL